MGCLHNICWVGAVEAHENPAASWTSPRTKKDEDAFVSIVRDCIKTKDLHRGTCAHEDIIERGLLDKCSDTLVTMYAKCGELGKAKFLMDMHKSRDVISWTSLISAYSQVGQAQLALQCYECMLLEGIPPNSYTYSCVLKACAITRSVDKGQEVHVQIVRQGLLHHNTVLGTALLDMYARCGDLRKAHYVHENLVSRDCACWNALITGFAQDGQGEQALLCFEHMQFEGVPPNLVTFTGSLLACGSIGALDKGMQIHDTIVRRGLLQNNIVLGNALVDMYAKCGALSIARDVLEKLPSRNVVTWSALIAGYAQRGQGEESLKCFECMKREGIVPNGVTYTSILKACATVGAADQGKQIHDEIMRQELLQNDTMLGTALVDMYVKCGALSKAQRVLEDFPSRNVASWSALIMGYAQEGQGEQVLRCFGRMQHEGILPNVVTFTCVLNACSHLGLIDEGHALFVSMTSKYGLQPSLECYVCMVDLLGRAGHIERAVKLIQEMPSSDHSPVWLALLGACRKWGDVRAGRWAFQRAIHLDKDDAPAYILMANIYATAGMPEEAKTVEVMRIQNKEWTRPECIWWINSINSSITFNQRCEASRNLKVRA